jgi:hypothetical protein
MNNKLNSSGHQHLVQEILVDVDNHKIVKTIVLMAVVFSLLVGLSNLLLENFTSNVGYRLIKAKWELLESQSSSVDVLVLGDSSANQGINTDLISELTGLSALNLATNGAVISVNDYWMLSRYIEKVGPPKCVVVGHVMTLWDDRPSYMSLAQIPASVTLSNGRIRELQSGYIGYLKILAGRYFRAFTESGSLKQMLMRPWRIGGSPPLNLTDSGYAERFQARPDNVLRDAGRNLHSVEDRQFRASRDNDYALSRMIDLAESHGIRLYLVNGPVYVGLIDNPKFADYVAQVSSFLSAKAATSDLADFVFEEPQAYSAAEMQNADHLVAHAARDYTESLARNLSCDVD